MSPVTIAIILGIVEGVTEYLPISSTGHLILFGDALNFTGDKAKSFEVIIQVGAILAVLVLFLNRFRGLTTARGDLKQAFSPGMKGDAGLAKLALATFPPLVLGFLFHHAIKEHLFSPVPVAIAQAVGAIIILLVESRDQREATGVLEDVTWKQAFAVGCAQCFALWPGMSRSGSAIIGGMLAGMSRRASAEFSFLAAVPILFAAAAKDFKDALPTLSSDDFLLLAIGLVVSFITALLTVRWFIGLVSRVSLRPFAWYRFAVAAAVLLLALK